MELGRYQTQAVIDFVSGWVGGIACVYTGQPLDTIKVKMQTYSHLYKNSVSCGVSILKNEGLRGFYAGSTPAVVANIAENSVLFLAYGQCQNVVSYIVGREKKDLNSFHSACAGALASVFSSIVLCPPEVLKCRLQTVRETSRSITPTKIVRSVIQQDGFIGFYRGFGPLLAREIPGSFFFFGGYEGTKLLLMTSEEEKIDPKAWKVILAGGMGGMCFWASSYPVDVVKSKLQISESKSVEPVSKLVMEMLRNEGVRSFYRGVTPTLIRSFPANAALFFAYEWSKKFLWGLCT